MNKISKKIISLVTMAAFVLTLVPAAAFAAPATANETAVAASSYTVVSNEKAGQATITFDLKSMTGQVLDTATAYQNAGLKIELQGAGVGSATVATTDLHNSGDFAVNSYGDLTSTGGVKVKSATPSITLTGLTAGTLTIKISLDLDTTGTAFDDAADMTPAGGYATTIYSDAAVADKSEASIVDTATTTNSFKVQVDLKDALGNDDGSGLLSGVANVKIDVKDVKGTAIANNTSVATTGTDSASTTANTLKSTGVTPNNKQSTYTFNNVASGT